MMKLFEISPEDDSIVTPRNVRVISAVLAAFVAVLSIFFTRDINFLIGLAVGTAVSNLLFRQHELSIDKMLSSGNPGKGTADYMIRLAIRGVVIYAAARRSLLCGIGSVLGLLTVPYGIYLLAFLENRILRKTEKEGKR